MDRDAGAQAQAEAKLLQDAAKRPFEDRVKARS
jgi:hypothetical protein